MEQTPLPVRPRVGALLAAPLSLQKMELRQIVEKYRAAAGGYGIPVPLGAFGLTREETEKLFSALDEDYQISRFFDFSQRDGESFSINGFPQTHIAIDSAIQAIL